MSADDDQAWLDALAGREQAAGPSSARVEGEMLRDALRAAQAARDSGVSGVPAHDEAREEALIARAVREGLIPVSGAGPQSIRSLPTRRRMGAWRPLLAAAVLACLAIGFAWQLHSPSDIGTVRDAGQGIARLEARDPVKLKQTLLTELRAAGVEARGYESLGVQGIDADLPQPLPDTVRRLLASHGIAEPRDGVLRIEIREAQ